MLQKMSAAFAGLSYERWGRSTVGFFEPYKVDGRKLSEDYSFCQRWRDIGGQVWADPNIRMAHVGTKTFDGHFGEWLRGRS
jgi:hypothetical protein